MMILTRAVRYLAIATLRMVGGEIFRAGGWAAKVSRHSSILCLCSNTVTNKKKTATKKKKAKPTLDSYLSLITINCPYPSVIVQSCNVYPCKLVRQSTVLQFQSTHLHNLTQY